MSHTGGSLTVFYAAMQNTACRCFADAKDHGIQDEYRHKADDTALQCQCDLNACQASKGRRKRHGMPPLEDPTDVRR
jgi:hypothetical protein